jgi:ribosomal protein L37AE/L43A
MVTGFNQPAQIKSSWVDLGESAGASGAIPRRPQCRSGTWLIMDKSLYPRVSKKWQPFALPYARAMRFETKNPIGESKKMNKTDRGLKHLCPDCGTKYYDLKKKIVVCPKCGAGVAKPKLRSSGRPIKKLSRAMHSRFS